MESSEDSLYNITRCYICGCGGYSEWTGDLYCPGKPITTILYNITGQFRHDMISTTKQLQESINNGTLTLYKFFLLLPNFQIPIFNYRIDYLTLLVYLTYSFCF